ncbi:hypothetical protein A9Q81_06290 [Gammaproteobacteria bacterium 42_54_T18]|nr:hypothetical protein A9Q81_06290 [Gammaproteobacteria bacterium 42_54_T18]
MDKEKVTYTTASKVILTAFYILAPSLVLANEDTFQTSLTLLSPITLTMQNSLSFPAVIAGENKTLITHPASSDAVIFSATGESSAPVTGTVVESFVVMKTGSGLDESEKIQVDSFITGGELSTDGTGIFDTNGELSNLRIGASAHIEENDVPGDYSSTATFRLTYN